ncbi:MAG: Flagellar basal-body rod protein FlgB, partial [uncultured Quadrisphaera sp.]
VRLRQRHGAGLRPRRAGRATARHRRQHRQHQHPALPRLPGRLRGRAALRGLLGQRPGGHHGLPVGGPHPRGRQQRQPRRRDPHQRRHPAALPAHHPGDERQAAGHLVGAEDEL